jgi:hypothetical protein
MPTAPTVKAYRGDARTLLAFNLPKAGAKNLAGFTLRCEPEGQTPYYLHNRLQFERPEEHAQDGKESPRSTLNAPIQKFRWIHVPGSIHQGTRPYFGSYHYTVFARYFDEDRKLLPCDPDLSASVEVEVGPFEKKGLSVAFTRGFTQSQAFVNHFGLDAKIRPPGHELLFDTSAVAGRNAEGQAYTYEDAYQWLGGTAREKILAVLDEVVADRALNADVFAYDLNEPDVVRRLVALAKAGRARLILDNAALHHGDPPKPEDEAAEAFTEAARGDAEVRRGKFGRYAHDKVIVVRKAGRATKVLTGSTNFSVTGLYVNSNHVLVFDDPKVASAYADVFDAAWEGNVKKAAFAQTELASKTFSFSTPRTPPTDITFSPHPPEVAAQVLGDLAARIDKESKRGGSVLFAVMEMGASTGPVLPALEALHETDGVFSYGISDSPGEGIRLYAPGTKAGLLVTGKPGKSRLPAPFSQVPGVGLGHQIHHKFVVCGFNGRDPVVYCGSSNLAQGGEEQNGDNLLAISDADVATVFAVEAVGLVDHFNFLDRCASEAGIGDPSRRTAAANKAEAARSAGWFLRTDDAWALRYYDPDDLRSVDRKLFG